jgi:integrase
MGVVVREKDKGSGVWWVFVNHKGRRTARRVGDKRAAKRVARDLQQELAEGSLNLKAASECPTLKAYADKWLDSYAAARCKFSTAQGYRASFKNHILPALGHKRLDEIRRSDVKELLYSLANKELSAGTVRNVKACLSSLLTHAFEDELIPGNPASRTGKLIRKKDRKEDVNPFTADEAATFLTACQEHRPRFHPFFLCALRTGMRLGELLALEWGDIDFRGGFIEVRRALVRGRVVTPKSGKGRRVDMSKQLAATLKALRAERKAETLKKGWGQVPEMVFCSETGGYLDGDHLRRRVFAKVLEKAGLRRVRIHDLRHTFATLLIQNKESLAYVKDQLGHHSIQLTVDTYGHLVPGSNRAAVDALDDPQVTHPAATPAQPETKKELGASA